MKLNDLRDNPGAHKARSRVGRGIGSGSGKTSGKGHKGQKSRSGVSLRGFEGGQMPLYRRLPKRGFHNPFTKDFQEINVGTLQKAVDDGKLDGKKPVDEAALKTAGLMKKRCDGVRLLGKGVLDVSGEIVWARIEGGRKLYGVKFDSVESMHPTGELKDPWD